MTALVVEALLASTLLMLMLMLALRGPARRLFGAQVAYALWAIPALRLLLPPLPEGWRGDVLPVLPRAAPDGGLGWPTIAILLWGAGLFLAWQVVDYLRFRHRVLHHGIAVGRVRSVTVVRSTAAAGPLAFGILNRVVAFPRDFAARFDVDERALALEHELDHHARGDLIANWVALAMLALHWFNPVAWIAFRACRADQEMANDAWVLARCGPDARHAYGCAIVKAAHGRAITAMCHLHNVKDLKGRLRMLATATLALGALALTASGTQAAERMRAGGEDVAGIDLAALDTIAAS